MLLQPMNLPTPLPIRVVALPSSAWAIFAAVASASAAASTFFVAWLTLRLARAEDRRHREGLQPHIAIGSVANWKEDVFSGYSVILENVGPGYASNIDIKFLVSADDDESSEPSLSLTRGPLSPARSSKTTSQTSSQTRPHSTHPVALKSGGTYAIAELADNRGSIAWLKVTYQDAFGQAFTSSVDGKYQPGVSFAYKFERLSPTRLKSSG